MPYGEQEPLDYQARRQAFRNRMEELSMRRRGVDARGFIEGEEKKNESVLTKIFDVLQRPLYATVGAVEEVKEGGGASDAANRAFTELFSGLGGLQGQKETFGDLLRQEGVTGAGAAIGGFAADVLLDPLTWVGPGLFKATAKGISKIPGAARAGAAIRASAPAQTLGRAFVPNFALRQAGEAGEAVIRAERAARVFEREQGVLLASSLEDAVKGASMEDLKLVGRAMGSQISVDDLPADLRMVHDKFRTIFDEIETLDVAAGVLDESLLRDAYMTGMYPEGSFLGRIFGQSRRAGKQPFQRAKTYATIAEREAAGVPTEFNIARLASYRGAQSIRARSTKEFMDRVLTDVGKKYVGSKAPHALPEGMSLFLPRGALRLFQADTIPQALVNAARKSGEAFLEVGLDDLRKIPALGKAPVYMMPTEIVEHLNSVNRTFFSDEATKGLLGAFDKVMNVWKGHATAVNPGFHFRNMYSNWFLNGLGGLDITDVGPYIAATKMQWMMREPGLRGLIKGDVGELAKRFIKTSNGQKYSYADVMRMAMEKEVYNTGWMGADIPEYVKGMLVNASTPSGNKILARMNPLSQQFAPLRAGRKMGTAIENNARLALFVDQLKKGIDPEQAATHVKKFLFDYHELTPFEKNVMKRLIPFYTWMRKNIPLQLEQLAKQPHRYAAVAKGISEIEGSIEKDAYLDKVMLPKWMQDLNVVQLPGSIRGREVFLNPNLPFQDLNRLGEWRDLFSSLAPPIKVAIEEATNKDIYFDRPIEEYPGQLRTTPEVDMLTQLMEEAGYDGPHAVPARWAHLIGNVSPFLRNVSQATQIGTELGTGQAPDPYNMARLMSMGVGIKPIPYSRARAQKNQIYRNRDLLEALRRKLREDERYK